MKKIRLEVVRFDAEDMIATSASPIPAPKTLFLSGFDDSDECNGVITFDKTDYNYYAFGNLGTALYKEYGTSIFWLQYGSSTRNGSDLNTADGHGAARSGFAGEFVYQETKNGAVYFVKSTQ